ncbi:hypothetical protein LTR78_000264 [Recurvomyces mirabilis]|uniref:Uncharacterized protein n=1 Tax=Recurvomyces mirabilis TaxID=574656 RepID=A0AAE0WXN7_9PEZI|nr:hypothetical protein LTR78_000264 [Recurvomyces mirabilis]KAK5161920.1 hypothetical protein LTS14_000265 [Recurvomyces mirabilis]
MSEHTLGKVVRKAGLRGRMGTILVCLQQVESTGLSLKSEEVMREVLIGIREHAARAEWNAEAVTKARKWAVEVASLLERSEHGSGKVGAGTKDARRRPQVLGLFLELAAVDAFKHKGGQDVDGTVRMYTERLLSCMGDEVQPPSITPLSLGPQLEMLHGVPIYHGLLLADRILGSALPRAEKARSIRDDYEAGLTVLAQALEARGDGALEKEGTYGGQALMCWGSILRD